MPQSSSVNVKVSNDSSVGKTQSSGSDESPEASQDDDLLHGEVDVLPDEREVVEDEGTAHKPKATGRDETSTPEQSATTSSTKPTEDSDVTSTPTKRRRSDSVEASSSPAQKPKLENDNVDSTCEENTVGASQNSVGVTKENNEVSSTFGSYEESIPDYSVDLKCVVSSCSTVDSFTTPESLATEKSHRTPVSESSEVVSSQDFNRGIVIDSK